MTTKKEIADKFGVTKRTVANYIERLGLEGHVQRVGQTDMIDDYATAALADAIGTSIPQNREAKATSSQAVDGDAVVSALESRIEGLEGERDRLLTQLDDRIAEVAQMREQRTRDEERHEAEKREIRQAYQKQLDASNEHVSRLTRQLASISDVQQRLAAAHWWQRGKILKELPAPGVEL